MRGGDKERRSSWTGSLLRGFDAAVSNNSQAFGFSISITVTFGAVAVEEGEPSQFELVAFAMAAVAAFSLLNLVAFVLLNDRMEGQSPRTMLVATATDFLAVGAAVGAAIGLASLFSEWRAWVLAPLGAGIVYVLVQSLELAVGDKRDGA